MDEYCQDMIKVNNPPAHMYNDLRDRDVDKVPEVDVFIAGFPCQPFSRAGKQNGFEDTRGNVFFYIFDDLLWVSRVLFNF